MASKTLTPRQLEIVRFIRDFRAQNGFSPTMQEIGDHLELTKVTVFEHVGALARKGVLLRGTRHSARSLQLSSDFRFEDEQSGSKLPLAGRIAAGLPIEAIEDTQSLDLHEMFDRGGNTFALQVTGSSMIGDHIQDGDFVICERRNQPRNGEMVVALLPEGEATLKRFYREKARIRLQPSNPSFKPIYVQNVEIQGVVVGVVRRVS